MPSSSAASSSLFFLSALTVLTVLSVLMVAASGSAYAQPPNESGGTNSAAPAATPNSRDTPATSSMGAAVVSKKDQRLRDKPSATAKDQAAQRQRWQRQLRRRIGKRPAPIVNIFNTWTHETIAIERNPRKFGGGIRGAKRRLASARRAQNEGASWHLRCHFTNEPADMDARLFGVLLEAAHQFKAPRIEIISGFRAPKYNLMLRKKGRQVARTSHHTRGEAVDFRIPGISTAKLRKWAIKLKLGGVGYYGSSRFIHVDIGKPRTWRGE